MSLIDTNFELHYSILLLNLEHVLTSLKFITFSNIVKSFNTRIFFLYFWKKLRLPLKIEFWFHYMEVILEKLCDEFIRICFSVYRPIINLIFHL